MIFPSKENDSRKCLYRFRRKIYPKWLKPRRNRRMFWLCWHVTSPLWLGTSLTTPALFQSSAAKQITALFWVITQPVVVISWRRFGTTYTVPSIMDSWPLKMVPIRCSETSEIHHHYSPRNNPEQHSSQLRHQFQTATTHFVSSMCLVRPCYLPAVLYNSRTTLHRPNAALHGPCLCFTPKHLLFYTYSFYVLQRIMALNQTVNFEPKICSVSFNKVT
jgi:hypothetical protein